MACLDAPVKATIGGASAAPLSIRMPHHPCERRVILREFGGESTLTIATLVLTRMQRCFLVHALAKAAATDGRSMTRAAGRTSRPAHAAALLAHVIPAADVAMATQGRGSGVDGSDELQPLLTGEACTRRR